MSNQKEQSKKTRGAWVVNHARKLREVSGTEGEYEHIDVAGRCGLLLSAISASDEIEISNAELKALARAAGINATLELDGLLGLLGNERLIDRSTESVVVLGLSSETTLTHVVDIFDSMEPTPIEEASIALAEKVSNSPITKKDAISFLQDEHELPKDAASDALYEYGQIGFLDSESLGDRELYFNGNLFRRENLKKVTAVIDSLDSNDKQHINDVISVIQNSGCAPKEQIFKILGQKLYEKVISIGLLDENMVGNELGSHCFITRPASFSKYGDAAIEDAFDLAKMFVTALTYGMTASPSSRGRIQIISLLMNKLIAGQEVGPATAIGHDYKVLELKGVIRVRPSGNGRYFMRLLKKDVGQLALKVIQTGEISSESVLQVPTASVNVYKGPEKNRQVVRKRSTDGLRAGVASLLEDLRTGTLR